MADSILDRGIKGGSPRLSFPALNKEYLSERNAALALKRRSAEIDLAIREGALLPAGQLKVQVSFLISAAREAVRAWHVRLPPLLFEQDLHRIGQVLREAEGELLNILADLPAALGNGETQQVEDVTPLAPLPPPPEETARKAVSAERERAKRVRRNRIRQKRRAAAKRGEAQ